MQFRFLALIIIGLLAVVGTACNDDDTDTAADTGTTSTSSTTEEAAVASGDPVSPGDDPCAAFPAAEEGDAADGEMQWSSAPDMTIDTSADYEAAVSTSLGDFTIALKADASPIAVNNFVFLACQGFYTDVKIHRVVPGFVFQTGDPKGDGTGGPGYTIEDEPAGEPYNKGTVSMARTPSPNSAGSQWFVAVDDITSLPPDYALFGTVTDGMDTVDKIAAVETEVAPSGEPSLPVEDIFVTSVEISVVGDAG